MTMLPLLRETPEKNKGWIHSYETSAGQDGPGWRLVVFLSGCLLRCQYCHNPDTWNMYSGKEITVDQVFHKILRYRPMLKRGGITFTGGEPLVQASFLKSLLRRAKENGVHTALDTAGFLGDRVDQEMMQDTDLVLLDIKSWDREVYLRLTEKNSNRRWPSRAGSLKTAAPYGYAMCLSPELLTSRNILTVWRSSPHHSAISTGSMSFRSINWEDPNGANSASTINSAMSSLLRQNNWLAR